jgi:acetaldehyde dehydrogenase (acetylating)
VDKDLSSIQEARQLAQEAHEAWQSWSHVSQAEVDRVCAAMAEAGYQAAERLGRLAQEETGFGVAAHKTLKNRLARAWYGRASDENRRRGAT